MYPDNPSLLNSLIRYYTKNGKNLDEGEKFARKLVALQPESNWYRQNAVRLFIKNNNVDEAVKIYGKTYIKDYLDEPSALNSYAWFWEV